jgi:putative DeoR family transcriptional regulator (stage III sporulation protein D)
MAYYIVENNTTVRKTAERFGISKSTVHKKLTVSLREINSSLFMETQNILQKNKSERHLRGGMATKMKYLEAKTR